MSSSVQLFASVPSLPSAFFYRDVTDSAVEREPEPVVERPKAVAGPTPEEIAGRISDARAEAVKEVEARLKVELEAKLRNEAEKIKGAINGFAEERKSYFARVESDVVQLALAITAKILHREAQVDPMLIAALVRIAVGKLHDGSRVTVRVGSSDVERWGQFFGNQPNGSTVEVVEDTHLAAGDCILETDMGSANFGIDAQLKEVEQGFFDLLAQRPVIK